MIFKEKVTCEKFSTCSSCASFWTEMARKGSIVDFSPQNFGVSFQPRL